jgi:chloramphenicol O-acetyltransferase type A
VLLIGCEYPQAAARGIIAIVPTHLDPRTWPRRETFELFRGYDKPAFNVCTRIDAAALKLTLKTRGDSGFSLACAFITLRIANTMPPFKLRLEGTGERVRLLDTINGSTTVLRADDSFGFAWLEPLPVWPAFAAAARARIEAVRDRSAPSLPGLENHVEPLSLMYFTSLPWLHFTSFSHARHCVQEASIPKVAFGRADVEGTRLMLPVSVEVHHALMDGVHVGRYVQALEAALAAPAAWLE